MTTSLPVSPQSTSPISSPMHSPPRSVRPGPQPAPFTLRSITGTDHCPPKSGLQTTRLPRTSATYFRPADDATLAAADSCYSDDVDAMYIPSKPRISSVTDVSHASPEATRAELRALEPHVHLPSLPRTSNTRPPVRTMRSVRPPTPPTPDEDDCASTYSHASAINLDDLDDDELAGMRLPDTGDRPAQMRQVPTARPQSFAISFAKARHAKSKRDVVVARDELQPHNAARSLLERCVVALTDVLDINLLYARTTSERFVALRALFTHDERAIISEMLRDVCTSLRNETSTPWRLPLGSNRRGVFSGTEMKKWHQQAVSESVDGHACRKNDTMTRAVVFGSHVIPGLLSAESILLRMAGEFHREEVNRKASRSERVDIPLSFAMTLTAALATFARLDCAVTYRKYRSRNAANRRSNPQALLWVKTRFDGMRLSFGVTLHGEAPCTVLFRRPRIFSLRKIEDYATLVTEAKDIISEFGREVFGRRV